MKLFISDDLPGIEEAVREIFPSAKWQLCVLHTVRDTLAKVRKKGQEIPEACGQVGEKNNSLLEFLNHPKGIRAYLYTTNQLERLIRVRRNTIGKLPCP